MAVGNSMGIGIPMVNLGLGGGGAPVEERFVISVKTDNTGTSADNEFSLPWIGTYDIDWGDGVVETGLVDTQTHTYPSAGTYDVKVTAATGRIYFNNGGDKSKLLDIKNWGTCQWTDMTAAFYGSNSLTNVSAVDIINLTNCTSLRAMFRSSSVSQIYTSNWDVSNITSLYQTFTFCSNIQSLDVSSWDVSNVILMESLFRGMTSLTTLDVSSWDVSNLSGLGASRFIFQDSPNINPDISNWVLGNNNLDKMLEDADSFDRSLANWDISNTPNLLNFMQNASGMSTANYDATLISWASQNPTSTNANFGGSQYSYEAAAARQTLIDTYGWTITDGGQTVSPEFVIQVQTDNVGTSNDDQFTLPWTGTYDVDWGDGNVETGVVDTQTHTYASAGTYDVAVTATTGRIVFNNGGDKLKLLDIKNWGSCQWTSMENAFVGCTSLTNLSAFDIPDFSLMTSMSSMFRLCVNLTANDSINTWDVSGITNMLSTFLQCYSFNQNIGSWDVSNVTVFCDNFNGMFKDASSFNNGGSDSIRNWDISSATALGGTFSKSGMFKGAASFNQPVNDWDTSNITITRNTFRNASTFNQPLDNWDTSNITDMQNMFANASVFNQSLAAWNIDQVADFNNFMTQVTLSTANYDATLISWAAQTPQQNINITFGNSQYTLGGAAETARNTLINTYGWTITDGGGIFVGLLDTYSGAAAAYSLRDLASASVGSAVVRVRRSNDNTEQDFTAEEITDGTLTTFTGANDGFVTTWYDQSGNGNNLSQVTAALQPKLVSNGSVVLSNNKPTVLFNQSFLNQSVNLNSSEAEHFLVIQASLYPPTDNIKTGLYQYNPSSQVANNHYSWTDGKIYDGFAASARKTFTPPETLAKLNLYNVLSRSSEWSARLNSNEIFTTPSNTVSWGTSQVLGSNYSSTYYLNGYISEFMIYPTDQSANRTGIETNINTEYTIY